MTYSLGPVTYAEVEAFRDALPIGAEVKVEKTYWHELEAKVRLMRVVKKYKWFCYLEDSRGRYVQMIIAARSIGKKVRS